MTLYGSPKVVQCLAGFLPRLTEEVVESLEMHRSGETPLPIFVVGPEVDPQAAAAEAQELGYPESSAVLMRTSGSTTGTGKIVAHSWDSLIASATATHAFMGGPGVWASDLPLHHIAGFQTVVRSVLAGLTPISFNLKDPTDVRRRLAGAGEERIYVSLVPTQLLRVLESPSLIECLHHATFLVGGAGTAGALLERAREAGLKVVTSYGMTETGGGCFYDGLPIGDTEVLLHDGRVSIRGSMVALGYLGDADPDAFASDETVRIHRTQDAGQISNGRLSILGRIDDAITTGGLTVMPRLIEDATVRATGADAVVVGIPDENWGEAVVAVLDRPVDQRALRSAIKTELGAGWAPTYVVELGELAEFDGWGKTWPITSSGKVNRRELARAVRVYFQR